MNFIFTSWILGCRPFCVGHEKALRSNTIWIVLLLYSAYKKVDLSNIATMMFRRGYGTAVLAIVAASVASTTSAFSLNSEYEQLFDVEKDDRFCGVRMRVSICGRMRGFRFIPDPTWILVGNDWVMESFPQLQISSHTRKRVGNGSIHRRWQWGR